MNSKNILASVATSVILSTTLTPASASTDTTIPEKQAQAAAISNIFGSVTQTINSPECTVKPI